MNPCHSSRRKARGVGLLDALIALVILSFGILGLTRMQTRLIAQTTEAQERLAMVQLADELMSTVLVDNLNAGCYTLPSATGCASTEASGRAGAWHQRAQAALSGGAAVAVLNGDRYTLTLNWTGKDSGATRTVEVTTDVR